MISNFKAMQSHRCFWGWGWGAPLELRLLDWWVRRQGPPPPPNFFLTLQWPHLAPLIPFFVLLSRNRQNSKNCQIFKNDPIFKNRRIFKSRPNFINRYNLKNFKNFKNCQNKKYCQNLTWFQNFNTGWVFFLQFQVNSKTLIFSKIANILKCQNFKL